MRPAASARRYSELVSSKKVIKRFLHLLTLLIVFNCIFILTGISKDSDDLLADIHHEKYVIETQVCHIPAMQPVNEMIEKYVRYPEVQPCPNKGYSLLTRNSTHIWINKHTRVLQKYKIRMENFKDIQCCYSPFYLEDEIADVNPVNIDQRIKYKECTYFNDVIVVEDEFVSVKCYFQSSNIYSQYFAFVPFKNLTLNTEGEKDRNKTCDKTEYNVLILGLDSVSRLNFHRTMPKTASFMKYRGAVEMMGYNKVGDNSHPNLVALLTGRSEEEIKTVCHPAKGHDDCPFLWYQYKDAGFHTAYGEDSGFLGPSSEFIRKGSFSFKKTPTDYYLHPYISEAERVGATNLDGNVFLCIYEHYLYQILLDYIQAVTDRLRDNKLFAFFWEVTISHDHMNYPMIMDESYLWFFSHLEASGYLDRTIVFLISDHGMRYGDFRKTEQGYLEERLPLALILTPPSFRNNFSEAFDNLKHNSRQLMTPFDLHDTLLDLINLENIQDKNIMERTQNISPNTRGVSLFLKIPQYRTCESAGISDHWCTCNRRILISNTSLEIANASKYLIDYLNFLLSGYPDCVVLTLDEVQKSAKFEFLDKVNYSQYSVTVKVKPSAGVFEATLRLRHEVAGAGEGGVAGAGLGEEGDAGEGSGGVATWSLVGTVSRLNLYASQSYCAQHSPVKMYCFCREYDKHKDELL